LDFLIQGFFIIFVLIKTYKDEKFIQNI